MIRGERRWTSAKVIEALVNQWYFGMKAHVGVDSKEGIVHSVCSTAASVADKHMLPDLLHGEETKV